MTAGEAHAEGSGWDSSLLVRDREIHLGEENNAFAVQIKTECQSAFSQVVDRIASTITNLLFDFRFDSEDGLSCSMDVDLITPKGTYPLFEDLGYSVPEGQELTVTASKGRYDVESAYQTCIADDWTLSISWPGGYVRGATFYNGTMLTMGHTTYDQCGE